MEGIIMDIEKFKFTVFTPTFNRKYFLKRIYDSLKGQTFKDFEWLIVDDGSTDNTKELVDQWINENRIIIRYIYKNNGGKHTAINIGVREARGELFLILDSDDSCTNDALMVFYETWENIDKSIRNNYTGVTALGMDYNGNLIGTKYPEDEWDMSSIDIITNYNVKGDKWGFNRTDVMKKFPFPEIPNEKFIPEGIVWNRIAEKYTKRNINKALKYIEYQQDGLSASILKTRIKNPIGSKIYYQEFINYPVNFKWKFRNSINYVRFSLHAKIKFKNILKDTPQKITVLLSFFFGWITYKKDLKKIRKE